MGKQSEFTPQGSAVNIILCRNSIHVLADNVRQEPGPMMITEYDLLYGGNEDGVAGLEERGMGVSTDNGRNVGSN